MIKGKGPKRPRPVEPVPAPVPEPSPEPIPPSQPPPPSSPQPSPDRTVGASIVDCSGGAWTIGPNRETLLNGQHAGDGAGSIYKLLSCVVWVLGTDANWYSWSGQWNYTGQTLEPGTTPVPAPGPVPPPPAQPPVPPTGPTYYVATTGNDTNNGQTTGTPWLTLAYAVEQLSPGDTLFIRGGTYTGPRNVIDSQTFPVPSGTSWLRPVTISGYPGETVVIQPPHNVSAVRLRSSTSYIIFQDFIADLTNSSPGTDADVVTLQDTVHHIRMQRVELRNGKSFGFGSSAGSSFIELRDSTIHDIGTVGGGITNGHGVYSVGTDTLFDGNELYNCRGYGYHIYNTGAASHADTSRVTIRNSRVHHIGANDPGCFAIVLTWGDSNTAYNNLIYDNTGGIQIYTGATNAHVYNNTIVANLGAGIALQYYGNAPSIKNNICWGNGADTPVDHGGTGTPVVSNNLTIDPLFVNAGAADFHLRPGSPAINAGADLFGSGVTVDFVGAPRQRGAYDIGAYQSP